jgi:hypothetical protein
MPTTIALPAGHPACTSAPLISWNSRCADAADRIATQVEKNQRYGMQCPARMRHHERCAIVNRTAPASGSRNAAASSQTGWKSLWSGLEVRRRRSTSRAPSVLRIAHAIRMSRMPRFSRRKPWLRIAASATNATTSTATTYAIAGAAIDQIPYRQGTSLRTAVCSAIRSRSSSVGRAPYRASCPGYQNRVDCPRNEACVAKSGTLSRIVQFRRWCEAAKSRVAERALSRTWRADVLPTRRWGGQVRPTSGARAPRRLRVRNTPR